MSTTEEMSSSVTSEVPLKRFYLTIFQTGSRSDFYGLLDRDVLDKIRQMVSLVEHEADRSQIDIWIESWGGDANAAYKLLLFLRANFKRIRAVVPDLAKSAATLVAVGCDEIFMSAEAELGPLDVQISHPDRENVPVSGLNVARALGFLTDFAFETITQKGNLVLSSTGLTRLEVLREMSRFSARFLEQVVAKLDPHLIHKAANELEVAQEYAKIVLDNRVIDADAITSEHGKRLSSSDVADHLVNRYPAHDFVISPVEARKLGLPVHPIEKYEQLEFLVNLHKMWKRGVFKTEKTGSLIQIWPAGELEALFKTPQDDEEGAAEPVVQDDQNDGGNGHEFQGDV